MLSGASVTGFHLFQWLALAFFVLVNGGYMLLLLVTLFALAPWMRRRVLEQLPHQNTELDPPVSLIVAAFNQEVVLVDSVRSLLQLDYPQYEIIVVNDGSTDATLDRLIREFDLVEFPEAFRMRVEHRPVRRIYHSRSYPELRVIDKENGGRKSDASNAGLNAARFPLVCPMDADSVIQRDSIRQLVRPFIENSGTVAAGGVIRLLNGCDVSGGHIRRVGLPLHPLALFQIVEYLRAFLFGRIGWAALDALPLISGAFGLFHRETIIDLGGYHGGTLAEDMELVLRIHSHFRRQGRRHTVTFVPDPVCWTEGPENLRTLRNQRIRWHRGLLECMSIHRSLLFNPAAGALGMIAMPFLLFFEGIGPPIEIAGYAMMISGFVLGLISWSGFLAFMAVALGLGIALTLTSVLLDVIAYDTYPRLRHVLLLMLAAVAENVGCRQLTAIWRVQAIWRWLRGTDASWGRMQRNAALSRESGTGRQGRVAPVASVAQAAPTRMAS